MIEIERKFLVTSDAFMNEAHSKTKIVQGYLNSDAHRTVRVRIRDNQGFLTIKGKSNNEGTTRFEWEKEIPVSEATELIPLCEKGVLDKERFLVSLGKHTFEIDVFHGDNEGLVVAEIELNAENEAFDKPSWLGVEVTGDVKYYNSQLSKHPFTNWGH